MTIFQQLNQAKANKSLLANLPNQTRQEFLLACSQALIDSMPLILEANAKDLEHASLLSSAMRERLGLDEAKIQSMAQGVAKIAHLPDPLHRVIEGFSNQAGLQIQKVSVPIGVIAIIYESRPNVTADSIALCIKSGNVPILKGGKEAAHSNAAIAQVFHDMLAQYHLPKELIVLLSPKEREELKVLLGAKDCVDLVIPRGGAGLIEFVMEHSKVPVIKHDKGVCHVYAHQSCNQEMAIEITINAKTSRPSVCNACETLLIDNAIAQAFLPKVGAALHSKGTKLKGCEQTCAILQAHQIPCELVGLEAYFVEYNDNILNICIVENFDKALAHIRDFSSGHSEAIVCEDYRVAEEFLGQVDSACVFVNASTRFSDGNEFGFGAEIGISTSKIHARGPMGLSSLVSYKYKIRGDGQIRI